MARRRKLPADLERMLTALPTKRREFLGYLFGEAQGNLTRAATMANYKQPRTMGSKLLTFGDVRAAHDRWQAWLAERSTKTAEDIIRFLGDMMDGDAENRDKLKAADQLSKIKGLYSEKRVVEQTGETRVVIAGYEDVVKAARGENDG